MSDPSLFDSEPQSPVRPYRQDGKPSSGWSGSDTSKDAERLRALQQKPVYRYVRSQGPRGATRSEIAREFNNDGGAVSGSLSVLHQAGLLARLAEKRGRNKVYVLPSLVKDRETEQPKSNRSRKDLARAAFAAGWVRGNNGSSEFGEGFNEWWESMDD